jgi:hypothetical protein
MSNANLCPLTEAYPHLVRKSESINQEEEKKKENREEVQPPRFVSPKVLKQQDFPTDYTWLKARLDNIEKLVQTNPVYNKVTFSCNIL